MKMKSIILLSKDILMTRYLPVYGNQFWKTPNIDELASKGTIFLKHYTAAPSTGMSFTSMFTQKFPHETGRVAYRHEPEYSGRTLFDVLSEQGYKNHIIWSNNYLKVALPYSNCFRNTLIHTIDMNQPVGPYVPNLKEIEANDEKALGIINQIFSMCKSFSSEKVLIWIHLPHVILGRKSYGDDIDLLDRLVGLLRTVFSDDSFFITADHGNMNGEKNKWVYGFDVYEPSIHIPLITPRIDNRKEIDFPTSNIQLADIITQNKVNRLDYVISDSAYCAQPNRCIAIIMDRYKLIYDRLHNSFSLYDIEYDPGEDVNLLSTIEFDCDRHRYTNVKEVYFYPFWDQAYAFHEKLMEAFNQFYKRGPWQDECKETLKYYIKKMLSSYFNKKNLKNKKMRK